MWYVGSKNKISKDLAPIIQSYITAGTKGYLEPFVGGANMIDKIQCKKRIGCDVQEELIELLQYVRDYYNLLPKVILENKYIDVKNNKDKYEKWYVGLVGFCATFGSKYFGGYARAKSDKYNGEKSEKAINNLRKQAPNLEGIDFRYINFLDLPIDKINNYVIYCDIPYRDTTKYKTEKFPYEKFYQWVKDISLHNTVLISEYNMPEEFNCIWSKETKVNFDSNRTAGNEDNIRIEKLFTYKV